jgi:hypothetical protein
VLLKPVLLINLLLSKVARRNDLDFGVSKSESALDYFALFSNIPLKGIEL